MFEIQAAVRFLFSLPTMVPLLYVRQVSVLRLVVVR